MAILIPRMAGHDTPSCIFLSVLLYKVMCKNRMFKPGPTRLDYSFMKWCVTCFTATPRGVTTLPTFDAAPLEISAVRAPTRQPMPRVHALRSLRKRGTSRKATETGPIRFVFRDWSRTARDGAYMQRSLTESTTSGSSGLSGTDNRSGPVAD